MELYIVFSFFLRSMELDDSLRYLGSFGTYQKLALLFKLVFTSAVPAASTLLMVFITSDPASFYCKSPDGLNWNETLPTGNASDDPREVTGCRIYEMHNGIVSSNLTECANGWDYSFIEEGDTSIVSEVY